MLITKRETCCPQKRKGPATTLGIPYAFYVIFGCSFVRHTPNPLTGHPIGGEGHSPKSGLNRIRYTPLLTTWFFSLRSILKTRAIPTSDAGYTPKINSAFNYYSIIPSCPAECPGFANMRLFPATQLFPATVIQQTDRAPDRTPHIVHCTGRL